MCQYFANLLPHAGSDAAHIEVPRMLLDTVFTPFVKERPIWVIARDVLERLLAAQRIDTLFARTTEQH